MSTKKSSKQEATESFSGFSILRGEHTAPPINEDELIDDIQDGDPAIIKDEVTEEDQERIEAGNKALEETIKKTLEAKQKKAAKEIETVENTDNTEEDEEDYNEDDEDSNEESTEESGYKSAILGLVEKGVLDVDAEEIEDSEEGLDKSINKTVENKINKWIGALPDDYKKFLNFVQSGGSPKEFLDVYYGNHSWETFKIEDEDAQKAAALQSLILSGETEEDAQDMVNEWADNGTLEKRAKSALSKLQKYEQAQKEDLVKQQEAIDAQRKQAEREYWENFKKDIFNKDEIKGFKLTPKMKENLWDFFSVPDKKTGKTGYQQAVENDKEAALLFALQAMNGFDIKKLEKQVETKVSSKYAGILKNYSKNSKEKISGGSNPGYKDNDPFKGFKGLKA